jgi:hypothetical protein
LALAGLLLGFCVWGELVVGTVPTNLFCKSLISFTIISLAKTIALGDRFSLGARKACPDTIL